MIKRSAMMILKISNPVRALIPIAINRNPIINRKDVIS
jgi:hypothetical protein